MKQPWIQSKAALHERLVAHRQVDAPSREAQMPPYMESFLSHLRLLIGVPFDYLVPDARLLPIESIRFFYVDRSWTDRLVDGAIAVGKVGSREQAHHQARASYVVRQLDITERHVRDLQRRRLVFDDLAKLELPGPADVVTGFLMRSRAVSGWPQMDVRAYRFAGTVSETNPPRNFDPDDPAIKNKQLETLRLERLAPGVLLALFQGVPNFVMCEEPHHGIQFGVNNNDGQLTALRRDAAGVALEHTAPIPIPLRQGGLRVLAVSEIRRRMEAARTTVVNGVPASPQMPVQDGAGNFAIAMLDRPWRQRFQGQGGQPGYHGTGRYVANFKLAARTLDPAVPVLLKEFGT
ncbi:hypothetical protein QTH91_01055 [Variovorax dokdonensis]|uniref:Uncharacterized protein n=1 Tax=Variovorax dokdonensis TaxID=344883 RepID=A0ABT7N560_9BURK|nr:hypothetical protein [Variovorax dokdonensis]MDM0043058.1 hypothetical protein [Variovorax dokdonensis]